MLTKKIGKMKITTNDSRIIQKMNSKMISLALLNEAKEISLWR
jgi:hypothetical protein